MGRLDFFVRLSRVFGREVIGVVLGFRKFFSVVMRRRIDVGSVGGAEFRRR